MFEAHKTLRAGVAATAAAGMLVAGVAGLAGVSSAAVRPAPRAISKLMVKVAATRGKYKDVLYVAANNLTLYEYTDKTKPCTGSCLDIWPPLLMAKDKTTPTGIKGLGTVKMSKGLQVTYRGKPLYTYYDDGGTSTAGVGIVHWVIALETSAKASSAPAAG
jgi:predicted lipoprotein with Yx(FWY)xxD motif